MSVPMKQCNHAGCRTLVPFNERYCVKHKQALNKYRYNKRMYNSDESKYQQFYKSTAWRRLSRRFLENNPICVKCYEDGVIRKADVVDHVQEVKDNWSRRLDESNLQALCNSHHNTKTRNERKKREQKSLKR
ncbi:HNH endonuclease [Liquorilactobacillus mali]|uniref:HNH endonuclease n=1 Tax=Liquorilactobacillus mali TaxID=1618 RepID=UPI00264CD3A5|nr:HNH endonuclease [Liquorilactobacillus mali]MDN7145346.1 HNH endonuclease [Liquorilactobacillus mali]